MKGLEQGRFAERQIATFRWTVAKPVGNEQSEAIGALRRKILYFYPIRIIGMSSSRKTCMFLSFGLITYHLRWITYISSKWLHTATSCGLNYVLRQIATFRWMVAKPMGNEQSGAIGALRRKNPLKQVRKNLYVKTERFFGCICLFTKLFF